MPKPFESPNFLLEQTRENLSAFDEICAPIFHGDCSTSVIDVDPQSGNKTFKVKFKKPIPAKARHIAATAISDLRHSLDQATCDIVRSVTGGDPGKIYFPFTTNPNDLSGRLNNGFPVEVHPIITSFQPYPTGKGWDGGDDLMTEFSKIIGPNKHQFTCKVGGQIVKYSNDNIRATKLVGGITIPPMWDVDNNEMIIGTTAPDGHIDYQFEIAFFIALSDAGKLSGRPVLPTIAAIEKRVSSIVAAMEAESARLAP